MAEKLTPRVGDRVVVSAGPTGQVGCDIPSTTGYVIAYDPTQEGYPDGQVLVRVDIGGPHFVNRGQFWTDLDRVTVVDREPVEWPDMPCWEYGDISWSRNRRLFWSEGWNVRPTVLGSCVFVGANAINPADARQIADGWNHVAEHWDELVGDGWEAYA